MIEAGVDGVGLSVVVMAFNEAPNLAPTVREIHAALVRVGRTFELVIVDDGSGDDTGPVADELAATLLGVRVVHHTQNLGLGGVYRTGFATARGECLTFFPADGQFPPRILEQFLPMTADHDLVLGYLAARRRSLRETLLSKAERVLYFMLFGVMPRFQGVMMLRRSLLGRIELRSSGRGWAVVMELILRASRAGARIVSVETEIRPRMSGQSKVQNARTIASNLLQVLELRLTL